MPSLGLAWTSHFRFQSLRPPIQFHALLGKDAKTVRVGGQAGDVTTPFQAFPSHVNGGGGMGELMQNLGRVIAVQPHDFTVSFNDLGQTPQPYLDRVPIQKNSRWFIGR
jgi:hypothetical protein